VKPVPATEIPETVNISIPVLVSVTVFVALRPTARLPKLTAFGDISIVAPVTPEVVPLPVTPTQPDITTITSTAATPQSAGRMDSRANRRKRKAPLTRTPSRMGARVITTRIVQRGRLPALLAGGTHLGQGHYPVRGDSLVLSSGGDRPFGQPTAADYRKTEAYCLLRTALPPETYRTFRI
jgi:hypothetical protein